MQIMVKLKICFRRKFVIKANNVSHSVSVLQLSVHDFGIQCPLHIVDYVIVVEE